MTRSCNGCMVEIKNAHVHGPMHVYVIYLVTHSLIRKNAAKKHR
jgi:hypothetical protein